jgi:hypothetical protein
MIDFDEKDIVAVCRTGDGERFVLFTSTDLLPHWGQKFWGAVLDTGGDGFGLPVRYGTGGGAPTGWALRQLVLVLQARMVAERGRSPGPGAFEVLEALERAARQLPEEDPSGGGIGLEPEPGGQASRYRWTLARCGDLSLPLCPDPASREEGIAPEQVLLVVDEALRDWAERAPYLRRLWACRNAVRDALAAEIRRVRVARSEVLAPAPPA